MELDHQMLHDWLIVIFFYVESVPDSTVHSKGMAGPHFPQLHRGEAYRMLECTLKTSAASFHYLNIDEE